jgi:hypothetical protein
MACMVGVCSDLSDLCTVDGAFRSDTEDPQPPQWHSSELKFSAVAADDVDQERVQRGVEVIVVLSVANLGSLSL